MLNTSNEFIQTMQNSYPKEVFVKLEIYDKDMNFIYELTEKVDSSSLSSISIDRSRAIRRSFSLALDNANVNNMFSWGENNLIWIDKRLRVYLGLKLKSGEIEYVLQGTYVVSDLYDSSSLSNGKKSFITGQDKAYLLGDQFGKIGSIYKELVGEDLHIYPTGESPSEINTILTNNISIPFVARLKSPGDYPTPTLSLLDIYTNGGEVDLTGDQVAADYFESKKVTHWLDLKPSPSGTAGDDPYRVFSKIYVSSGSYTIISDSEAAYTSAVNRNDYLDFPTYYEATIFMIHAFQRSYFDYYQGLGIDIGETNSHIRPTTTAKVSELIGTILDIAGENESLVILDPLPQYSGDPSSIEVGTDILTRDLEYSEGTTYIQIIQELAELIKCEFYYDVHGKPTLKKKELNNFQNEPVVWTYDFSGDNKNSYIGNERKMDISNLANQINVYAGGAKDASYQYRLKVTNTDSLFVNSPYAIEKIGRILYSHNGGEPDPNIKSKDEAIYRALWELKQKLGYGEQLPITVTPNYVLEPSDIIQVIDSDSGILAKYVVEKIEIPITPSSTTIECRRENLVDFDWESTLSLLKARG